MENAFKISIENGYCPPPVHGAEFGAILGWCNFHKEYVLLDPSFWQALCSRIKVSGACLSVLPADNPHWIFHQHRYVDHIANKGNAEEFFTKMIEEVL